MATEKLKIQLHGSKIKPGPINKLKTINRATNSVQLDLHTQHKNLERMYLKS